MQLASTFAHSLQARAAVGASARRLAGRRACARYIHVALQFTGISFMHVRRRALEKHSCC